MNHAKELKKEYGKRYLFRKYLTDQQLARLKADPPTPFLDTAAASLEVGCVRLDAVLFRSPTGMELGYDILVRESPNSLEWICYDTVPAKAVKETDMAAALDRYVGDHGLSYTDCGFTRLDGKFIKAKGTPL